MTIYFIIGIILITMIFINSTNFNLRMEPVNEPINEPTEHAKSLEYTHYEYLSYDESDDPPSSLEIEVIEDGVTYGGVVELSGSGKRNSATQQYVFPYQGTLVEIED